MSRRLIFMGLLVLTFLLAFQNCRPDDSESTDASSMSGGSGTGNGYDGKLYSEWSLIRVCDDGTSNIATIKFEGRRALLVRENCRPLPKEDFREVPVEFDNTDSNQIIYDGRTFVLYSVNFTGQSQDPKSEALFMAGDLRPAHTPDAKSFLARYDGDRELSWAAHIRDTVTQQSLSIRAISARSAVHVSGIGAFGMSRESIFRISTTGSEVDLWDAPADIQLMSIDVQADSDFVYVTGQHRQNLQYGLSFIAKMNSATGEVIWLRNLYSVDSSASGIHGVGQVRHTPDGVYVTGFLSNRHFLTKLSPSGEFLWSKSFPSSVVDSTVASRKFNFEPAADGVIIGTRAENGQQTITHVAADGSHRWTRQLDTPTGTYARLDSFAVDQQNGIYAMGEVVGNQTGLASLAVFKFTAEGIFIQGYSFAPPYYAEAMGRPVIKNLGVDLMANVEDAHRNFAFGYRLEWQQSCPYCSPLVATADEAMAKTETGPQAAAAPGFVLTPNLNSILEGVPRSHLLERDSR